VMAVDPAGGRQRQAVSRTAARQATAIVGQDLHRRVFVLHSWADRLDTERFMQHLLDTYQTWTPRWVGIEANAMQSLFGDALVCYARDRGVRLPYVPIYPPTNVDKLWRIRQALQLPAAQGRLFFQADQAILRQEYQDFPNSVTVDAIDALAMAVAMLPAQTRPAAIDAERQALADTLRAQGVAPRLIQARLQQYDRELAAAPAA